MVCGKVLNIPANYLLTHTDRTTVILFTQNSFEALNWKARCLNEVLLKIYSQCSQVISVLTASSPGPIIVLKRILKRVGRKLMKRSYE